MADANAETGIRPLTTTALQALYTMNDPFFHAQADGLALRAGMNFGSDAERLAYAYKLLYGRAPAPDEIARRASFSKTREISGRCSDARVAAGAWFGLVRCGSC